MLCNYHPSELLKWKRFVLISCGRQRSHVSFCAPLEAAGKQSNVPASQKRRQDFARLEPFLLLFTCRDTFLRRGPFGAERSFH